jgi:hypothetical protein
VELNPVKWRSREGDCLAAKLQPGNVQSAKGWEEVLLSGIERQQRMGMEVAFGADAAFAKRKICEPIEERGAKYTIHILV